MTDIIIEDFKNQLVISEYIDYIDRDTTYFVSKDEELVICIASLKYLCWDSKIFNKKIYFFAGAGHGHYFAD